MIEWLLAGNQYLFWKLLLNTENYLEIWALNFGIW